MWFCATCKMGTCTQGRGSSGRSVEDNPGKVVGFAGWEEGIMTRSDLLETYFFVVFVVSSSHNGWTIFQPDLLVFIPPITWFGPTTIGLSTRTSSPGKTVREATWKRKTYTWFRTWYLSNCLHSQTLDRLYLTRKSVTRDILKHTCALFVNLKHAQVISLCK